MAERKQNINRAMTNQLPILTLFCFNTPIHTFRGPLIRQIQHFQGAKRKEKTKMKAKKLSG